MSLSKNLEMIILGVVSVLAIAFGIMTVKSGSFALFGGVAGKQFAGKYIPFVLWFNFIAGFFYIIAGVGLFLRKQWSKTIAKFLALLTILVFIVFGVYVATGVDYEVRTVGAMLIRSFFWVGVFLYSKRLVLAK